MASAGLPAPEVNTRERPTGRRYELDASWPTRRLAVELDGWESRALLTALEGRNAF